MSTIKINQIDRKIYVEEDEEPSEEYGTGKYPVVVNLEFKKGDVVYLKTDTAQYPRIVIGFTMDSNNSIRYCLACSEDTTYHEGIEISKEKDVILIMSNY